VKQPSLFSAGEHRQDTAPRRSGEVLREVVNGYLSASHRGALTQGFASLDTQTILVRAGVNCPVLFRELRAMQKESLLVCGEMDSIAVDVVLTAKGLGLHMGGGNVVLE